MSEQLTPEQVANWRSALVHTLGPYALIMPVEQIEAFRNKFQGAFNAPEARKPSHPETGATMTTPKQDSQMQAPDPSCAVGAAAPETGKEKP